MLKRLEQLWQKEGRAHRGDFISHFCHSPGGGGGGEERRGEEERRRSGARSQTRDKGRNVGGCSALLPTNRLAGWAQPISGSPSQWASAWHRHAVLLANAWAVMRARRRPHRCASPPIYLCGQRQPYWLIWEMGMYVALYVAGSG